MKEAKHQGRDVILVRDRLFIDGEQYISPEERPANNDNVWTSPLHSQQDRGQNTYVTPGRPMKRPRQGSSPNQENTQGHV